MKELEASPLLLLGTRLLSIQTSEIFLGLSNNLVLNLPPGQKNMGAK